VDVPPKTAPRLFLIDAYALIYRAYFAFIQRPLTNSRGENTSAPFGFVNFLIQIREKYEPDYLAVVFDAGMSQREVEYPAYKATREKMPDDLRDSLPRVRALVEAFHDPVVAVEGYEADDVIGTLARQARERGVEAVVVSGDKDFYQLVGPGVHLLNPGRGGPTGVAADWVDERNAGEKFGLPPSQVVDYLALIGDSSDNVPGAPGIGPKTAVALLQEYGSVDALLERAGEISGKRARESLQENAEQVRLSKRLVTIQTDVPVELDLEAWTLQEPDRPRLREVLAELEFRTLIDKYAAPGATVAGSAPRGAGTAAEDGAPEGASAERAPTDYRLLTTTAQVDALVARIRERGEMSVDTETTDLDPMRARLVGIAVSLERGEGSYLPFRHRAPVEELELELEDRTDESIPNLPSLASPEMAGLRGVLRTRGSGRWGTT
jgi:DNA polymerase I